MTPTEAAAEYARLALIGDCEAIRFAHRYEDTASEEDFFEYLDALEAAADRWNSGALDGCRGKPQASQDPDYLEGFAHGVEAAKVQVTMPARPEGYYHSPIGTFD